MTRPVRKHSVAVVGRYFNTQGGVSNVMAQLASRAASIGDFDVTVFSHEFLDFEPRDGLAKTEVQMLERPRWLQRATFGPMVRKRVLERPFDLVHVHDPQMSGGDLYTAHSCFSEYIDGRRTEAPRLQAWSSKIYPPHALALSAERRAYSDSRATVVAVSGSVEEQINRRYRRAVPARHIYNGVDIARYRNVHGSVARAWLNRTAGANLEHAFKLAFVGYEFDRKRLHVAMDVVSRLGNDVALVVAGKGPIDEYKALARQMGIGEQIHFLGHVSEVENVLRACDAFIFPTRYEAASLAILEALAAELPVVTTDVAMAHEVLTDGETGLLLPNTDDPTPATNAVRRLMESAELRGALSRRGTALVARFSWDSIWEQYSALYSELIRAKSQASRSRPTP